MKNNTIKTIAIGSDHGGFELKEKLKIYLSDQGYEITDCGTSGTESVDYPKYAFQVAHKVSKAEADIGIIIDGAGIGSAMTANKVSGVRAAMCYDVSTAGNAREHNDANVLTLGGTLIGAGLANQIADVFLTTFCSEERHKRRVEMINELDTTDNPTYADQDQSNIDKSDTEEQLTNLSQDDLNKVIERVKSLINIEDPAVSAGHSDRDMVSVCGVSMDRQPETLRHFLDSGVDRFGYHDATGCESVPEDIAACIDHTILKPDTTEDDIIKLCKEAREYNFATVCISPAYVPLAHKELTGSKVKVCTVVGFPHGANLPEIKAFETRRAIRDGAEEIDMVINIGALKSSNYDLVYRDIRMVCEACEDGRALSKVIIEAAMLTNEEKIKACELAKKAKANYVKTSTGFGPYGATAEDVELMRSVIGSGKIGLKAAGGIRSYEDAKKMITAGATRIGASAGIKILQEAKDVTITQ
jgi:deoxyribose-phosphate aldolase